MSYITDSFIGDTVTEEEQFWPGEISGDDEVYKSIAELFKSDADSVASCGGKANNMTKRNRR
jgi:hypothetical protein